MKRLIGLTAVLGLALGGCGDDDSMMTPDTGMIMFDAGTDTGETPDMGMRPDVPTVDMGTPDECGDFGEACTPDRGCARSEFCQAALPFEIGGTGDPIQGLPDGTSLAASFFAGGYCTPDDFSGDSLNICDPDDDTDPTCGSCGSCLALGAQDTMCLRNCEANATDNDICRDGYTCLLGAEVCFTGCTPDPMDIECRAKRRDNNGIPGIQTPFDCDATSGDPSLCGGDPDNFDRLEYDPEDTATCSTDTYRCDDPGTPGAVAGDTCLYDDDCEANGRCLDEATFEWPGGYCIKDGCNTPGFECAEGGVCEGRGLSADGDFFLCLGPCTVASEHTADDPATWLTDNGGCRDGYACFWNGRGGEGVEDNGFCIPGEFNDVTDNNVGGACEESADCWSPFGQGRCFQQDDEDPNVFRDGYCTVSDCNAPGVPADICGADAACVALGDDFDACVTTCETGDDCRSGYGCIDLDGMPGGVAICFPGCGADTDCPSGETCNIPAGETNGVCVP